jgi:hypothetical protein
MAAETRPRRSARVIAAALLFNTFLAGAGYGSASTSSPQLSPPRNVRFGPPGVLFPSAQGVQVIDGFNRPEDAGTTWASTVTRMVLRNQTTGFVLKTTTPCTLAGGTVQKVMPITTTRPSYLGAKLGTYYDAIVPLTSSNCSTATYLYLDIAASGQTSVKVGDATINLEYHGTAPVKASLPMMIGFSNFGMILGYCGTWCAHESDGIYPLRMLVDHRLQPYGGQVLSWDGTATDDWHTNNLAFSTHYMMVAFNSINLTNPVLSNAVATMAAHGITSGAWTYNKDEPQESELTAIEAGLANQKALAPSIRTMITTEYRANMPAVDIWAPVAEYLGNGHPAPSVYAAAGKSLWMYVSCMSNGCGNDRYYGADPRADGNYAPSGAPDLVIDRTAVEAFGFYLLGYKYNLEALLYYNSIEGWRLWSRPPANGGPLDIWTDQYNFGGNGDGTLMYPGNSSPNSPGLTYRPYPSIRLKLLREASYMVDALKQVSDQTWAHAQVDALVRTTIDWDRDMAKIAALRNAALGRLR